jgi:hypothetical protein
MVRILAIASVLVGAIALPTSVFAAAPSNDNLASAKVISPGSLPYADTVNMTDATTEPSEPVSECSGAPEPSIWWSFTPSSTGTYRPDTQGSSVETVIDIYSGNALTSLVAVDCNDDVDANNSDLDWSRVAFHGKAGTHYKIRVKGDPAGTDGVVHFALRKVTAPSNDNYSNAMNIASLPFDTNADVTNATSQSNEPRPSGACSVARATRWYKYTPSADELIWANTFVTADNDTVLGVYTGSNIATANLVLCNDDQWIANSKIYDSGVTFKALAGVTYRFQVAGYDAESGENGEVPFHVRRLTAEANDDFGAAMAVPSLPFKDSTNMRRTSRQAAEPSGCGVEMANSSWYAYTAPSTTPLTATATADPDITPHVAVYTGSSLGSLTLIGCGPSVDFVPTMGTTYRFQVSTDYAVTAPVAFNLQVDSTP